MSHRRKVKSDGEKDEVLSLNENPPATHEDLLRKIKELEKKNKELEDQNRDLDNRNKDLDNRNKDLEEEVEILKEILQTKGVDLEGAMDEIKELRRRVNMNSTNSSKPPSSDGYRKPSPKSQRVRTGRKRGGQPGHTGHGIVLPHEADVSIPCYPTQCEGCPRFDDCKDSGFETAEKRYTVDVEFSTKVTEHVVFRHRRCPESSEDVSGEFPEGVSAHIQYGDSVAIVAGLLNTYGAVSDQRISTLMRSLFGITVSPGTVVSMVDRCHRVIAPVLEQIRKKVVGSEVVNFDETGARTEGKLFWVHNSSTPEYTFQTISTRRGTIGMEENGVLPAFKGVAVHDCWMSYWKMDGIEHATCGAHFLRELNAIEEMEPGHRWPKQFRELLLSMKSMKESVQGSGGDQLPKDVLDGFSERYDSIMALADMECPPPPEPSVKRRGRRRKGKERALIERFQALKGSVCMFAYDFRVPFDNNQAERDVRNVKTKIKVSGCFRSREGASNYLSVMSYLSTARKHGINPHEAMSAAFDGKPDIVL